MPELDPANAEVVEEQPTGSGNKEDPEDTGVPTPPEPKEEKEVELEEEKAEKPKAEKKLDEKPTKKAETKDQKRARKRSEIADSWGEKMKDPEFDHSTTPDWVLKELGIGSKPEPEAEPKEEKPEPEDFDKKMENYEATKQFKSDKELLKSLPLSLRNKLTEEANELKNALDVPVGKALNRILKTSQKEIEEELGHSINRKIGAALPASSSKPGKGFVTEEQLSKMKQKEYNSTMEKVDAGKLKIQEEKKKE